MGTKRLARAYSMLTGLVSDRNDSLDPTAEPEFVEIFEKCRKFSMTSWERMYALYKSVRYIVESGVEGDFVECGVWRGGSVMMIAYALLCANGSNRNLYLYDTYEGMSRPTDADVDSSTHLPAEPRWKTESQAQGSSWAFASLSEVQQNVYSTGYPKERLIFVKGPAEETIPGTRPEKIALLRLDTDWYASTKHELVQLYPRLTTGGVLIIDDYGQWLGAKKAVDEYFASLASPILLTRIDYTGRLGVKR